MSSLSENSIWEATVNQVETGETITGGPAGRANQATGQLTNRTKFLKDAVDGLTTDISDLEGWTVITGATTMTDSPEQVIINAGVTYTLKVSPSVGDSVRVGVGGDWETTNSTIARNGSNIMGLAENLVLDINRAFRLTYQSASRGWVLS